MGFLLPAGWFVPPHVPTLDELFEDWVNLSGNETFDTCTFDEYCAARTSSSRSAPSE